VGNGTLAAFLAWVVGGWRERLRMTQGDRGNARVLYADQRKQHVLETLRRDGRVDAAAIAADLSVTGETVRKDLVQLERQGLLRRVHGGAVPVTHLSYEPAVDTRTGYLAEKVRIAKAALAHLPDRGTVLIDAGSTTAQLVEVFPGDRELTVYTNTLPLALQLLTRPLLTVYTLGGRVRTTTYAEVDDWAARALSEINVDVAFLGANGISVDRGLTTPDPSEAAIKRRMLSCAHRRILLADHSKIGAISGVRYGSVDDIDLLITDDRLDKSHLGELSTAGLEVDRV
jgi:DeoR family transcriptional regulator, fructose operon transcriptional repressor